MFRQKWVSILGLFCSNFIELSFSLLLSTKKGYIYRRDLEKATETGIPHLKAVLWENPGGELTLEAMVESRGGIADVFAKKPKRRPFNWTDPAAQLVHSGDGSVPYLSLSWAHTWLLHAARARRYTEDQRQLSTKSTDVMNKKKSALDYIHVSHRPRGEIDWIDGPPPVEKDSNDRNTRTIEDTGTSHPHGTRYSE
jgi:hypothetical protein